MIYFLSWTTKNHQINNSFQATTFKVKENSRILQGLAQKLRTFQGQMEFNDFSRTSPKIQRHFKTVQALL